MHTIPDYKSFLGEYEKLENESEDRAKIRDAVNVGITLDEVTHYASEIAHAITWAAINQAMAEGNVVLAGSILCNIFQHLSDEGVESRIADPDRITARDLKRTVAIAQMGVKYG
jgi:hypothetical protein